MAEASPATAACQSQALHSALAALRHSGGHRFDPVRFRYIEAMAERAPALAPPVGQAVVAAALTALHAYQKAFSSARHEAAAALKKSTINCDDVQQLFHDCRFRDMHRLLQRRRRARAQSPMSSLFSALRHAEQGAGGSGQPASLADILRRDEQQLVEASRHSAGDTALRQSQNLALPSTVHHLRAALEKRSADKVVTGAIMDIPEDAGPLNPQKLIVQSLASMRDLSPQYLNRFVAYIDTLLWLEEAGGK